ncbi:MAG: sulfotransferase domain-containing protein [Saprospiraceae bacterium]
MSQYSQTLSLYLKHFHPDQIFLIWFEDIYQQPEILVHDIFSFLGVDPMFSPKTINKKSNPARSSHYAPLQFMIRRFNMAVALLGFSGVIKKLKMAGLGDFVMKMTSKPIRKETIPEEEKQYILMQVKEDIQRLEKMTGKDLSHWLV